jgi:hypothetical protein
MEYIRWLIKRGFEKDPALILPMLLLSALVVMLGFFVHPAVGVTLLVLALGVFGTIAYVLVSDAFRASYARFQKEKTKP